MKKTLTLIAVLLFGIFILSGCVRRYSHFYDYGELMQNLVRTEIIYFENATTFFVVHGQIDIEDTSYEIVRELTHDEADRLIRGLSNVEFTYYMLWAPVVPSTSISMQGYAIKLSYVPNHGLSDGREPFIIVAQTGDYGYGMRRLSQARAGRRATDEDWNALMSGVYFEERSVSTFGSLRSDVNIALIVILGIVSAVVYVNIIKKRLIK